MWKWIVRKYCEWFGHVKSYGPLNRSPYTCHTHTRDIMCARCGQDMGWQQEFYDVRKNPELF
jgi:hypothetical protein